MGGRAFGFESKRMDKDEYDDVLALTLARINSSQLYTGMAKGVISVKDKMSFGDIDILVPSEHFSFDAFWNSHKFRYKDYIKNGGVISLLDKQDRQIDIITTPLSIYDIHYEYLAYNDFGNFVGRLAKVINLRYGHDGLSLMVRGADNNHHKLGEILISRRPSYIYELLDVVVPSCGFNNMREVYDSIMSSKYYHRDSFLLENQTNKSRVRDRKRKSYNELLEYIKTHDTSTRPRRKYSIYETIYLLNNNTINIESLSEIHHHLANEYITMQAKYHINEYEKTLFNGNIVRDITGLTGKGLGKFMSIIKHEVNIEGDVRKQVNDLYLKYNRDA